jgi:hypothetical protein
LPGGKSVAAKSIQMDWPRQGLYLQNRKPPTWGDALA